MKDAEFQEQAEVLIMKITQTVILLQLERKSLFVYTTAGLTKVWIRYDIGNSARRSQQGLRLYRANDSLRPLQPWSGEVLRSGHKTGVGN